MKTKPLKFGTRYPWTDWFKKSTFTITEGKDFHCQLHGMAQMVRATAARLGYKVNLKIAGKTIEVSSTKKRRLQSAESRTK